MGNIAKSWVGRNRAALLLFAGCGLGGCVIKERYQRDLNATVNGCEEAIELLVDMCRAELIKQKKDRGLRF